MTNPSTHCKRLVWWSPGAPRWCARLLGAFALASAAIAIPAMATDEVIPPWEYWCHSDDPILPPPPADPLVYARFEVLYNLYQVAPTDTKGSFSQWLVQHGVRDPRTFTVMMQ